MSASPFPRPFLPNHRPEPAPHPESEPFAWQRIYNIPPPEPPQRNIRRVSANGMPSPRRAPPGELLPPIDGPRDRDEAPPCAPRPEPDCRRVEGAAHVRISVRSETRGAPSAGSPPPARGRARLSDLAPSPMHGMSSGPGQPSKGAVPVRRPISMVKKAESAPVCATIKDSTPACETLSPKKNPRNHLPPTSARSRASPPFGGDRAHARPL